MQVFYIIGNAIRSFFVNFNQQAIINSPWLVASLVILFSKYQEMRFTGYRVAERALGRDKIVVSGDSFSMLEYASFYTADVFICLAIIPALIFYISVITSKTTAIRCSLFFSISALLLFFIQSQSMSIVGASTSYSMIIDSFGFAKADPAIVMQYLSISAIIKMLAALLLMFVAYFIAKHLINHRTLNVMTGTSIIGTLLFSGFVVIASPIEETKFHESLFKRYVKSFLSLSDVQAFTMDKPTPEKLKRAFSKIEHAHVNTSLNSEHFGAHKGSDLILIIMETAPVEVMGVSENNPNLSNISKLLRGAVYSNRHYTTFPYSNLAIYSMLTSWYPTGETLNFVERDKPAIPSFINPLINMGYHAKMYVPCEHVFDFDKIMYQKTGLGEKYISCLNDDYLEHQKERYVDNKILADTLAFDEMKKDIQAHHKAGTNYAYIIAPQLGHAPWPAISGENTAIERGKAIVKKQDEIIGDLIDMLNASGKLDDTIIVITSDHGIRTRKEDPDFPGNVVDAYSFNVPLIIHAPKTNASGRLSHVTSHIDILPSLMDIMGVNYPNNMVQGRSVFRPPVERIVFFNANYYLGADAFYYQGKYHSVNHSTGELFSNPDKLDFKNMTSLSVDKPSPLQIQKTVMDMYSFQNYWQQYYFKHPNKFNSQAQENAP